MLPALLCAAEPGVLMHTAEHDVEVTWEFSIFVVEIRFVCNNHAFQ